MPDNLRRDGRNYIEWIWSLLDDGIPIPVSESFTELRTDAGEPLLDPEIASHLDEGFRAAQGAASANGHRIDDVVTCCSARELDGGPLCNELARLFFVDAAAALSRAQAIGEICDVVEEFCAEAAHLKRRLATDGALPMPLRRAIDAAAADQGEGGRV
ncbi:hypothetical protein [Bradyrhizobium barranii]